MTEVAQIKDPRICIIGAGNLSTRRIYPYIGQSGAELVGTCDLDREKAELNARRFGGRAYTDFEEMIANENPDGVIICVGPEAHYALSKKILKMGIPVYTEKPPAPSAEQALEIARLAADSNVLCTNAFKKRYSVSYERAKSWIEQYEPNQLLSISADYCSGNYPNTSARSLFLLDFAIHMIDLIAYLYGDVEKVFSFSKGQNAFAVSMKFANGAVGSLNFNCGRSFSIPTEEVELTIEGGNFMTIHNSSCWKITENGKTCEWREPNTFVSGGDSGNDTGHLAELVDFVNAVKDNRKTTRSSIYESYKSMVLYEAIQTSVQTGETVSVEYQQLDAKKPIS